MHLSLGFFSNLAGTDGLVVLVVALLIFGRRLPEAGKNFVRFARDFRDHAGFVGGRRRSSPRMSVVEALLALAAVLALLAVAWEYLQRL